MLRIDCINGPYISPPLTALRAAISPYEGAI